MQKPTAPGGRTNKPPTRLTTTTPPSSWLQLLVLGPAMFGVTDGCLRRSSQPDTTRTTTPSMDEDPFRSPTPISSHRYPCAQEEIEQAQCLNGGTCYAIEISRKREAICNCPPEWVGTRCEEGYIDPDILGLTEDNMRTASIAAGVSVCILVIFVLLLAIYVYLRKTSRPYNSACVEDSTHHREVSVRLYDENKYKQTNGKEGSTFGRGGGPGGGDGRRSNQATDQIDVLLASSLEASALPTKQPLLPDTDPLATAILAPRRPSINCAAEPDAASQRSRPTPSLLL